MVNRTELSSIALVLIIAFFISVMIHQADGNAKENFYLTHKNDSLRCELKAYMQDTLLRHLHDSTSYRIYIKTVGRLNLTDNEICNILNRKNYDNKFRGRDRIVKRHRN